MEKERAKEIIQSQDFIPVQYKGKPVYINKLDEQSEVACVFPLDNLNSSFNVEISSLHDFNP
ncbi:H-type small acid-soluble spore protein [Oceanobacillus piezotolerans]|uniref:Small, acid-soluble spore protein H n=1 Tax=Oceanobacillus piezotolerans TaxID=2448030 RepID=A0A498DB62_9BACI|nr:H-type small acid-soluble spore protein [Oceanobacillus piezotolerans]RLL42717.1 H-type small acid-soluble spore protein [Oceanobacillus piezotolerans]